MKKILLILLVLIIGVGLFFYFESKNVTQDINLNQETKIFTETHSYKFFQVGQTKVIYPKDITNNELNEIKEIIEKNYISEKYVAVKSVAANFNEDGYLDAVFTVYSDLGKSIVDKGNWDNPFVVNTNPEKLLGPYNDFDTVSADRGCVFVALGDVNGFKIVSTKCLFEKEKQDEYYIKYLNYGSIETDVQVIDMNADHLDDIIRFGMSTDLYTNGDFHKMSAIFQTLSDKYELIDLSPTNKTGNVEGIDTSEEIEDSMFGTSYDNYYNISIYKYNDNGYVYIKNIDIDHSDNGGGEYCNVISWRWQGKNSFIFDKKESARKTGIECK